MILWRALPWRRSAEPHEPGGALWFARPFQGAGRHDRPERYGCLYASEEPVTAVAELLAPFRGSGELRESMLVRLDMPLALARLELADPAEIVDLDDARTLVREDLRPSEVATRHRAVTQASAERLFESHPAAAGLRWWSTLEASLANVTLFDRAAPLLEVDDVGPLALDHPAVTEAAELLGLAL